MTKYVMSTIEVDAIQWFTDVDHPMVELLTYEMFYDLPEFAKEELSEHPRLFDGTNGILWHHYNFFSIVRPSNWIITTPFGFVKVMENEKFEMYFRKVSDD